MAATVDFRLTKHHAAIRLLDGFEIENGGLSHLWVAVEECAKSAEKLHAIFIEIVPGSPATMAEAEQPLTNGSTAVSSDCRSFEALLDKLGELPPLLVGFASGSVGLSRSCLLAVCDVVFAAPDARFQLLHSESQYCAAMAPFVVLRRIGTPMFDHVGTGNAVVGASCAHRLGMVSDIVEDATALKKCSDDLSARISRNPVSTIASLKWLQKRVSGKATTSTASPVHEATTCRKRLAEDSNMMAAKRSKVSHDPFHQQCERVVVALEGDKNCGLPATTRDVLIDIVCAGSKQLPAQRSGFEGAMVNIIGDALTSMEAVLRQRTDQLGAMIEVADAERVIRDATVLREESHLESMRAKVVELKKVAANNNDLLRVALNSLARALEEQETGDATHKQLCNEKTKLESLERDVYTPAKNGLVTKKKANSSAKDLMVIGKSYGFDESLLIGLPGALSKKPEDRSSFDSMVLQAFESQVMTRVAELDKSIAEECPGREARAAVVESARSAHESVKGAQNSSLAELAAAQATLKDGDGILLEARKSASAFDLELQQLAAVKEEVERRRAEFCNGPLAALDALRKGEIASKSSSSLVASLTMASSSEQLAGESEGPEVSLETARDTQDTAVVDTQPDDAEPMNEQQVETHEDGKALTSEKEGRLSIEEKAVEAHEEIGEEDSMERSWRLHEEIMERSKSEEIGAEAEAVDDEKPKDEVDIEGEEAVEDEKVRNESGGEEETLCQEEIADKQEVEEKASVIEGVADEERNGTEEKEGEQEEDEEHAEQVEAVVEDEAEEEDEEEGAVAEENIDEEMREDDDELSAEGP